MPRTATQHRRDISDVDRETIDIGRRGRRCFPKSTATTSW